MAGRCDMKAPGAQRLVLPLSKIRRQIRAAGRTADLRRGDRIAQSRGIIEETARGARAVYNSEPGRATAMSSRSKGGVFMVMDMSKSRHSGANFEAGRSAINALATRRWRSRRSRSQDRRDLERRLVWVDSRQHGGASASGQIDMRYARHGDRGRFSGIERSWRPSMCPALGDAAIKGEFLPLEQTAAMPACWRSTRKRHGRWLTLEGESRAAARFGFHLGGRYADAVRNRPVGGLAHSPEEYLEVESIVPRALALANAVAIPRRSRREGGLDVFRDASPDRTIISG